MKIRESFLPLSFPHIDKEDEKLLLEVFHSGWWTTGPKVFEFEELLCNYIKKDDPVYAVALDSCTSALYLSLMALDIKEGDEVIVPTWTFVATSHVVEWLGAKLVLCDVERESLNIDLNEAEKLINEKTKAIMPVHIAGYPVDIDKLNKLAQKYNLKVIEDAAHAIGTKYKETLIGNHSDAVCYSFYASKNLAMGEGGAVVSRDKDLIEKIRKLAYFGINKEAFQRYKKKGSWQYDVEQLGYKCNLSNLHASIGVNQLKKLDPMTKRRVEIANRYKEKLFDTIQYTKNSPEHFHCYHLFPVFLPDSVNRDEIADQLKERNIGSSVHFIPLHKHSYYMDRFDSSLFPAANEAFQSVLSLPMFPSMTDEDVDYVCYHLNSLIE